MSVLLHVGIEHPSLLWIGVVGLLAFVAGLGVNLALSARAEEPADAVRPSTED